MKPNFELFQRGTQGTGRNMRQPTVSIVAIGDFGISKSAYELLGSPTHVELLYDSAAQIIGLRPCDEASGNGFRVCRAGTNGSSITVNARTFCRHFGIPTGTSRRYLATVTDGVLMVDLTKQPINVGKVSTSRVRSIATREAA